MEKLDYGTLLSPFDIPLKIGTLRKPRLRDIAEVSFDVFSVYELFMQMAVEDVREMKDKTKLANAMREALKDTDTNDMYDLITRCEPLQALYTEIFDFFFTEPVAYREGYFVILKSEGEIKAENVKGVIGRENFRTVRRIIRQVLCMKTEDEDTVKEEKFKNDTARELFERMRRGEKEREKASLKNRNGEHSLPNIISVVSNRHKTISPINVWGLTVFQLFDAFNRMQVEESYDIRKRQVSVWGDKDKTFDFSFWSKPIKNE